MYKQALVEAEGEEIASKVSCEVFLADCGGQSLSPETWECSLQGNSIQIAGMVGREKYRRRKISEVI